MSNFDRATYEAVMTILNDRETYIKSLSHDPNLGEDFKKTVIREVRVIKDLRFAISYDLGFYNG